MNTAHDLGGGNEWLIFIILSTGPEVCSLDQVVVGTAVVHNVDVPVVLQLHAICFSFCCTHLL